MIQFKGPGFKIFAAIIAVTAIAFGIWITFFESAGYDKTTATIVSIEEDPDYIPDQDTANDVQYITTVKYTVDGKEYTTVLGSYDPTYKVGKEVEIMYDPKDPSKITSGIAMGIYAMIAGGVILALIIGLTVKKKIDVKKIKESCGETVYAPSEKGEKRTLYFLTDLGTPKYGHHIEDKYRRVLYEAKMTKYSPLSPYKFDFIDHENNKTVPHIIGHEEERDRNSIIFDNYYTFSFDGEDIWKHLKRNGITVESRLGSNIAGVYTIFKDGEEIAYMETTSKYVHEEDEAQHSIASKVPVPGFYRINTAEKNLDVIFITALAFARSKASDDKGGSRRVLFNTMKGR